jgi:hypothetical protein
MLNPRHLGRPKAYQPAAEAEHKVEEARKDPKIKARIKTALERWAACQPQSAGLLRVDDGKPPVNTNTFVISTSPLLSTHGHDGHGVTAIDALTEPVETKYSFCQR